MTFIQLSTQVASNFLQTVVVVDDQAQMNNDGTSGRIEKATAASLKTPGRRGAYIEPPPEASLPPDELWSHRLDAGEVIDAFAKKGLVCAVLKPDDVPASQITAGTLRAARRADLVLLDWRLHKSHGDTTIELIKWLINKNELVADRSRLIAIYTAEPDLNSITNRIAAALNEAGYACLTDEPCVVNAGSIRIPVLSKTGTYVLKEYAGQIVEVADLPNRLIDEFAKMTAGLVSNVAIEALSAIRNNTHKLLTKLGQHLDPPYLTHRALLECPEDAALHLVPLILSELQAIIEDQCVWIRASDDAIDLWLDYAQDRGIDFRKALSASSGDDARRAIGSLFKNGLAHADGSSVIQQLRSDIMDEKDRSALDKLTHLLCSESDRSTKHDLRFALLMSMRSRYGSSPPVLELGTILMEEKSDSRAYWVCVQPLCDSVRISDKRTFPFLRLSIAAEGKEFGYVIDTGTELVKLKVSHKLYRGILIEFKASPKEKMVLAKQEGNHWYFDSKHTEGKATVVRRFRWLANLKPDHAQRIAVEHAHQLSRVGLTESEWLRRWGKPRAED